MDSPATNDRRWRLLLSDVASAAADLAAGARLYQRDLERTAEPTRRREQEKAFQKFLQDGYASIEKAMVRTLELFGEIPPRGASSHSDLPRLSTLTRLGGGDAEAAGGRPPFARSLAPELRELMRFRHVAIHGYEEFELERARPAAEAAARVAAALPSVAEEFGRAAGLLR